MSEKSHQSVDSLPSYSESVSSASRPTPSLPRNITQARTAFISDLINTQIIPHLHSNALSGLANTTLLIIPSSVSSLRLSQSSTRQEKPGLDAGFPNETIVGFSSAENLTLIRLQGQENNLSFWVQQAVISELWQQLCSQLQNEGYRIARGCQHSLLEEPNAKESGSISPTTTSKGDWRTAQKMRLQAGEANVEVGVQEICLRVENLMGLYETKTGKALVVKVEIGG